MKQPASQSQRRPAVVAKPVPATVRRRDRRPGVSIVPLRSGPLQRLAWIFGIER
jgi:hypothetical protein